MPASLGSLRPGAAFAYLVEITNRSRSAATRRPTIFSLSPPVYILAVSMKLPPASTKASKRSEEHTSELQSLMRISYAVFCLKKKKQKHIKHSITLYKHYRNKTQ